MDKDYFAAELPQEEVRALGSLALAHVGDAVFELLVRLHQCRSQSETCSGLHQATIKLVNAHAQAEAARKLLPFLTEEETDVYKRGRNTKVNSMPKHALPGDYHAATGLEALFGWLYLMGRRDRVNELFGKILEGEDAA